MVVAQFFATGLTGLIAKISIKYVLPTCIWKYFWGISWYFAFLGGFRGNTWILRVCDHAKYQKPWLAISNSASFCVFASLNSLFLLWSFQLSFSSILIDSRTWIKGEKLSLFKLLSALSSSWPIPVLLYS